jgi:RHS repeat-associated protein
MHARPRKPGNPRESASETSLYCYRPRYYDPTAGRFTTEDPFRFKAGVDFYAYTFNDSINLIDPRGYTACCASNEEPDIRKRINTVRNFLDQLDATGTIAITGTTSVLAATFCQGFKIKGHEDIKIPSQATTTFTDPSFKTNHPCLGKCAEAHEALHRAQCISMGADKYSSLTEKKKEFPAYMVELGCLIKILRDSGLNTIF